MKKSAALIFMAIAIAIMIAICSFQQPTGPLRKPTGNWIRQYEIATKEFNKCQHIYVAVESDTVYISLPETINVGGEDYYLGGGAYRTNTHFLATEQGQEIVCIKCFHKTHQIIKYDR